MKKARPIYRLMMINADDPSVSSDDLRRELLRVGLEGWRCVGSANAGQLLFERLATDEEVAQMREELELLDAREADRRLRGEESQVAQIAGAWAPNKIGRRQP